MTSTPHPPPPIEIQYPSQSELWSVCWLRDPFETSSTDVTLDSSLNTINTPSFLYELITMPGIFLLFLLFSFKFSFKTAKNETNFWREIVWIYPSYLSVETVDFSWTIFFVETGNSSWIHAQDRQLDGTCVIRAVKKLGLESGQPIMGNEHGAGSFVPGSFG